MSTVLYSSLGVHAGAQLGGGRDRNISLGAHLRVGPAARLVAHLRRRAARNAPLAVVRGARAPRVPAASTGACPESGADVRCGCDRR